MKGVQFLRVSFSGFEGPAEGRVAANAFGMFRAPGALQPPGTGFGGPLELDEAVSSGTRLLSLLFLRFFFNLNCEEGHNFYLR